METSILTLKLGKMPKEKAYVPVVEPKSTSFLEIVELGRIVTPNPTFKRDEIHVRLKKICRGNPEETFDTVQTIDYSVPWVEKEQTVENLYHQEKVVEEKVEVKVKK